MDDDPQKTVFQEIVLALVASGLLYGREHTKEGGSRAWQLLKLLYDRLDAFEEGLPDAEEQWSAGMLVDRNAIWFRRAKVWTFLKCPPSKSDLFYDGHSLHERLKKSWEAAAAPAGAAKLALRRPLGLDIFRQRLAEAFGIPRTRALGDPERVFVCGIDDGGITWLGYRDGPVIAKQLLSLDQEGRAKLLQQPIRRPHIGAASGPTEPLAWWTSANTPDKLIISVFSSVARDVLRNLSPGTEVSDGIDVFERTPMAEGATVVAYLGEASVAAMNQSLSRARAALTKTRTQTLILCVPTSVENATALLQSPDTITVGYAKRRLLIFDIEQAKAHLSRQPWVWSKYFGNGMGFRVVRNDPSFLATLLLDEQDRAVLLGNDAPMHPAVRATRVRQGMRVRVRSRSACGRSTALFQLARQAPPTDLIIVLAPSITDEEWTQLRAIIEDDRWTGWWFLVDNHDVALTHGLPPSLDRVLQLLPLPAWRSRESRVSILLTYAAANRRAVEEHVLLRDWPVVDVTNDRDFTWAAIRSHVGGLADGVLTVFARQFVGKHGDGTLRAVIREFQRYRAGDIDTDPDDYHRYRKEAGERWRARYEATVFSPDARQVLWIIAAARGMQCKDVPHEFLSAFFGADTGDPTARTASGARLRTALVELTAGDWITVQGGVCALTVDPDVMGVEADPSFVGIVRSLAVWTAQRTGDWSTVLVTSILLRGAGVAFSLGAYEDTITIARGALLSAELGNDAAVRLWSYVLWLSRCFLGQQDLFLDDVVALLATRSDGPALLSAVCGFWSAVTEAEAREMLDATRQDSASDIQLGLLWVTFPILSVPDTTPLEQALQRRALPVAVPEHDR